MNKQRIATGKHARTPFSMKMGYYVFLLGIVALLSTNAVAQDLKNLNLSWKYQPDAPLQLSWDLYQPLGQKPVLLLQLQLSQPTRTKALNGYLHYKDSLYSQGTLHKETIFTGVNKGEASQHFRHSIDTARGAQWLILELQHTTDSLRSYWYTLHLPSLKHFGIPAFYLQQQEKPLVGPFALLTESFSPRFDELKPATPRTGGGAQATAATAADSLFMFVYELNFAPAASPMTLAPTAAQKMEISRRQRVSARQTIQPTTEGFYFLQADTLTLKGQGVRAENKYFPKTRTVPDFAGPIRYLSTNEEWTELEREEFSKKAIDRYWLRMTQSEDKARKIIRSYYRRVTQANRLFTSFKEGWKTDMGMIYILYGAPDAVYQLPDGELWSYKAKGDIPEISFTFVRAVNPFDQEYYQLVRKKDYARTHFQIVSKWRRGQNLP